MARTLLISGAMQRTTTRRTPSRHPLQAFAALIALAAALALFAPNRASADSVPAIKGTSAAVIGVRGAMSVRILPGSSVLRPAPAPASTGFISEDLLNAATNVVNNGIRLGSGPGNGTFYVHFKPQGFGGVLSIRYRR